MQRTDVDGFERALDAEGLPPAMPGKVTCLVDGPAFFGEFDRLMDGAERSLDLQMFIFDNDDIAVRYADRLRQASASVKVRVPLSPLRPASLKSNIPFSLMCQ